jgi:type III restriction enzyme
LQGWQRDKFYPDFVALTKTGNIIALEWKGEHLRTGEDTKYKEEVAKVWEQLGEGKLHFFLVYKSNMEDVLNKIKGL